STTHRAQFRLRVASSPVNLADVNCSFRATRTIQVLVNNCLYVLKTKLSNISGKMVNSFGNIYWSSTNEEKGVQFVLEKSTDGTHFKELATVQGNAAEGFGSNYHFTDPNVLNVPAYYRVVTKEHNGSSNSRLVLLSPVSVQFDVRNVLNPFDARISFDVVAPADGTARVTILDNYGRVIKSFNQAVTGGVTPVKLTDHGAIAGGVYALKVEYAGVSVIKRIVKVNN
ncbi:MAG: T9SS type A sorting domain-containing protein, partial [Sphingobacteriales bacterium]